MINRPILIRLILQRPKPLKLVYFLIRNAPDIVDKVDEKGYTALLHSAKNGQVELVEHLLRHGASPDIRETSTIFGDTASSWASYNGHIECLDLLLRYGANKDQQTINDGKTLLMWAYSQNHPDVFTLLVQRGSCLRKRNRNGFSLCDNIRGNYKFIMDHHIRSLRQFLYRTFTWFPEEIVRHIMLFY